MAFARSKKTYDPAQLYEYAVQALGRRMRSVAELKRLLRLRNVVGDKDAAIEAVITKLKDQRYLNDTQFASTYSSLRKDGNKFGRQRVIIDLKIKGVHADVIEKTVSATYEGVDEESLAREYLRRKRVKQPSAASRANPEALKKSQKETARVFRMLVRAGFRTGTIIKILKNWNVEDELLGALQEESES
ncbi:MAG: regulatory protein RecX [Candidatus Angelobacter sp.]|nr:regulatory protein RecX [Candidatus Angelobacter sp.]